MPSQNPQIPPSHAVIDKSHPLSKGLVCCWHPNSGKIASGGGGIAYDMASKSVGVATTGVTLGGNSAKFSNSKIPFADRADHKQTTDFTVFVLALDANQSGIHTYVGCDASGSGAIGYSIFTLSDIQYRWRVGNGSFVDDITEATTVLTNTVQSFALVYQGKPGTASHVGYRNGVLKGTQTSGVNYTGNIGLELGWAESNVNSYHQGNLYCAYVWNRALPQKAIYELDADPFQFFTWAGKTPQHFSLSGGAIKSASMIDGSPFNSKVVA